MFDELVTLISRMNGQVESLRRDAAEDCDGRALEICGHFQEVTNLFRNCLLRFEFVLTKKDAAISDLRRIAKRQTEVISAQNEHIANLEAAAKINDALIDAQKRGMSLLRSHIESTTVS